MKKANINAGIKVSEQCTDKRAWSRPKLQALSISETNGISGANENDGPVPRTAYPKLSGQ